ncbi:MAG: hypothetical protein AABY86_03670 [Bdellovibrionota bacterium]
MDTIKSKFLAFVTLMVLPLSGLASTNGKYYHHTLAPYMILKNYIREKGSENLTRIESGSWGLRYERQYRPLPYFGTSIFFSYDKYNLTRNEFLQTEKLFAQKAGIKFGACIPITEQVVPFKEFGWSFIVGYGWFSPHRFNFAKKSGYWGFEGDLRGMWHDSISIFSAGHIFHEINIAGNGRRYWAKSVIVGLKFNF